MLAVVAVSWLLRWRGRLFDTAWFLRASQLTMPLGFLAVLAGWTTTEVGRQPWTIYGLLRTVESVSPSLTGLDVLVSLLCYMVVYLIIYPTALWFIVRLVRSGPEEAIEEGPIQSGRPAAPVRALPSA